MLEMSFTSEPYFSTIKINSRSTQTFDFWLCKFLQHDTSGTEIWTETLLWQKLSLQTESVHFIILTKKPLLD